MRSDIDGKSILTNCSMVRIRTQYFQLDDCFDDTNRRFVRRIQESVVRETLKRMKGGKTMGPDGIIKTVIQLKGCVRILTIEQFVKILLPSMSDLILLHQEMLPFILNAFHFDGQVSCVVFVGLYCSHGPCGCFSAFRTAS